MGEIYIYGDGRDPTDVTNNFASFGLVGALTPTECTFHEAANGESSIQMQHPIDDLGRYLALQKGRILSVPVPVRTTPEITDEGQVIDFVYQYSIKPANQLTNTKQRTLFKKATGSTKMRILDPGTKVIVVEVPVDPSTSRAPDRVKVKTEKYGTGWVNTAGLDGWSYPMTADHRVSVTGETQTDKIKDFEAIMSPWTVQPQLFRIYEVNPGIDSITVNARHISYDLLYNMTTFKSAESKSLYQVVADPTTGILNNCYVPHEFKAHAVQNGSESSEYAGTVPGLDYHDDNPINAFLDPEKGVCKMFDVGLIRDNFDLYFIKDPGVNRGIVVEYGKNITDINCTLSDDEVATMVLPVGEKKDGTPLYLSDTLADRVIVSTYVTEHPALYPIPKIYKLECENCKVGEKDPDDAEGGKVTEATAKARMRIQAQKLFTVDHVDLPKVEMDIQFVNLGDTEEYKQFKNLENCFLFDYINIRDYRLPDVNVTARITEIEWDCLLDVMNSVKIGEIGKTQFNTGIASWQIPSGISGSKISDGTISSGALRDDVIDARHIQANTINSQMISTNGLDASVITSGTLNSDVVYAGYVDANKINAGELKSGVIYTGTLSADNITTGELAADVVYTGSLTADQITSGEISAGVVYSGTINTDQINAGTLSSGVVYSGTINTNQINAGTLNSDVVYAGDISATQIKSGKISADVVSAQSISAAGVAAGFLVADDLSAAKTKAIYVDAVRARINSLVTDTSSTDTLKANIATITSANITNAEAQTISVKSGVIKNGYLNVALIEEGHITSAMIGSLNADVIESGTLKADRLILKGTDGIYRLLNSGIEGITQQELSQEQYQKFISGRTLVAQSVSADKIVADSITAKQLASGIITSVIGKIGKITTSHISSDFGSSLDLSSNTSINFRVKAAFGGRNLLMPTKDEFSMSGVTSDIFKLTEYAKTLKSTDPLYLSFEAKASTPLYIDWYFTLSEGSGGAAFPTTTSDAFLLTTTYTKYACVINQHADLDTRLTLRVRQSNGPHAAGSKVGTVYLKNVMLERATEPTSWSPAPEEVDSDVGTAQATATSAQTAAANAQSTATNAQTAAANAQADIDGLAIGGRNLFIGSATALPKAHSGATLNVEPDTTVAEWGASDAIRVYGTGGTSTIVAAYTGSIGVRSQNRQQYVGSIYVKNNSSDNLMIYPNGIGTEKTVAGGASTRVIIDDIVGNGSKYLQLSFRTETEGDTFDFVFWHPKMETGNRATDWTPAPEDVDASISDVVSSVDLQLDNVRSQITASADNIKSEVVANYATKSGLNAISQQLSSAIEQTERDFTLSVSQITQKQTNMESAQETTAEQLALINTYMTFGQDGLEIGKTGDPLTFRVDNDRLSFYMNDIEVAYLTDNKLYINHGEIKTSMKIGKFSFEPQANGNMSLIYTG